VLGVTISLKLVSSLL